MSKEREKQIVDAACATLVGRKIVGVAYVSQADTNEMGWSPRAPALILDDGTQILAVADDEGNDGGVLDVTRADGEQACFLGSLSG